LEVSRQQQSRHAAPIGDAVSAFILLLFFYCFSFFFPDFSSKYQKEQRLSVALFIVLWILTPHTAHKANAFLLPFKI
jgi:hypothetical protein